MPCVRSMRNTDSSQRTSDGIGGASAPPQSSPHAEELRVRLWGVIETNPEQREDKMKQTAAEKHKQSLEFWANALNQAERAGNAQKVKHCKGWVEYWQEVVPEEDRQAETEEDKMQNEYTILLELLRACKSKDDFKALNQLIVEKEQGNSEGKADTEYLKPKIKLSVKYPPFRSQDGWKIAAETSLGRHFIRLSKHNSELRRCILESNIDESKINERIMHWADWIENNSSLIKRIASVIAE